MGVALALALGVTACGSSNSGNPSAGGTGAGAVGGSGAGGSAPAIGGSAGKATGGAGGGAAGSLLAHAIAATQHGTCALDAQGAIQCWGLSRIGEGPWQIPQGTFAELYGSMAIICAVRSDRTYTCFPEPVGIADLSYFPDVEVQQLALETGDICGIDVTGSAFCDWNTSGNFAADYALPIPTGEVFQAVSVGVQFACGIRTNDGTLQCWGSPGYASACNWAPQVGQLDAPAGSFIAVDSRVFSSCGIKRDGTLACWGAGKATDDASALFCDSPYNFGQSVPPSGTFASVSVGYNHACAVDTTGHVACWGAGDGTIHDDCTTGYNCDQSVPPDGVFAQVAAGGLHTCAMRADRTVQCWGWDGNGDGRTTPPAAFQ